LLVPAGCSRLGTDFDRFCILDAPHSAGFCDPAIQSDGCRIALLFAVLWNKLHRYQGLE
jgi:hypothetical protein